MSEFEKQVLEELCVLKTQMQQLLGIGQPGRLHQLEMRVEAHERSVQRLKGLAGAMGGLLTVAHLLTVYLGRK